MRRCIIVNDTAATEIYTRSRHDALPSPIFHVAVAPTPVRAPRLVVLNRPHAESLGLAADALAGRDGAAIYAGNRLPPGADRKSTRLNSSHPNTSYAVFCL